jgi:hypothetical protein
MSTTMDEVLPCYIEASTMEQRIKVARTHKDEETVLSQAQRM